MFLHIYVVLNVCFNCCFFISLALIHVSESEAIHVHIEEFMREKNKRRLKKSLGKMYV